MCTDDRLGRDDGRRTSSASVSAGPALFAVATLPSSGDDRVTLAAAGEIDRETAPALQACLATHLRPHGPDLVIDLSEVFFLSLSGLSVLARAHQQAAAGGQQFLVILGDRCRGPNRMVQASGLLDLLTETSAPSEGSRSGLPAAGGWDKGTDSQPG